MVPLNSGKKFNVEKIQKRIFSDQIRTCREGLEGKIWRFKFNIKKITYSDLFKNQIIFKLKLQLIYVCTISKFLFLVRFNCALGYLYNSHINIMYGSISAWITIYQRAFQAMSGAYTTHENEGGSSDSLWDIDKILNGYKSIIHYDN